METVKVRRAWTDVLKNLRAKMPAQTVIPNKLPITINGENKIFHYNATFKHLSTNPALQKVLKGRLQPMEVNYIHKNKGNKHTTTIATIILV